MDKLSWFKFSISDWIMGKIMKCPEVTQARFIRLCCLYWNKKCSLSLEDAEIEIDGEHLEILLKKKVVNRNGDFLIIKFLDEQNDSVKEVSKKRKEAVTERWNKAKGSNTKPLNSNTSVPEIDTNVLQNDTEENREEKKEEIDTKSIVITPVVPTASIDFGKFMTFFNGLANRKFKATDNVKTKLKARLKTYSKTEIFEAIKAAHKDEYHIKTKFKFLTPEFILREDKLDKFLNQPEGLKAKIGYTPQTPN